METARNSLIRLLGVALILTGPSSALAASTVDTVTISPDPATVDDTLTCAYNFSDDEGDADASTIQWEVNGLNVGTASTLSGVHSPSTHAAATSSSSTS